MNISQLLLGGLTALMSTASGCTTHDSAPNERWFTDQRWSHRMLVCTNVNPGASTQSALLEEHEAALIDRDLLVIQVGSNHAQLLAGSAGELPGATAFRERFDLPENAFEVVLVGKDGRVKERRIEPMNPDELWAIIDAMPMRMREMREDLDSE